MAGRVTIQDIADALGISRNTVSKAINNTGVLAEATREKVLKKAVEMGYKQFSYINLDDSLRPSILVDNITAAWDDSDHMQELLYDVAMKGAGYGIYLIATAPGSTFPFKLSNFFKTKLSLNQNEKSEYTSIVGMSEIMPEPYPGRGLVKLDYPVEFPERFF